MPLSNIDLHSLYETDYMRWIETTVEKLRQQDYDSVDWVNLIDEIEDMSRSERRSLMSNLIVVLLHLLKWQFQPERRSSSWAGSIVEHRRRIQEVLDESPSLRLYFEKIFAEAYSAALRQAKAETALPLESFPPQCPYSIAAVLDDEFFPE